MTDNRKSEAIGVMKDYQAFVTECMVDASDLLELEEEPGEECDEFVKNLLKRANIGGLVIRAPGAPKGKLHYTLSWGMTRLQPNMNYPIQVVISAMDYELVPDQAFVTMTVTYAVSINHTTVANVELINDKVFAVELKDGNYKILSCFPVSEMPNIARHHECRVADGQCKVTAKGEDGSVASCMVITSKAPDHDTDKLEVDTGLHWQTDNE
jgi:hypothetical protein